MLEILNVVATKSDFTKYRKLIEGHLKDPDLLRIFNSVEEYYTGSGLDEISWPSFSAWFLTKNPLIKDDKLTIFNAMFDRLDSASAVLSGQIVDTFLRRAAAERIAFSALQVAEGRDDSLDDVQQTLDNYLTESGLATEVDSDLCSDGLSGLLDTVSHGVGLSWRLDCLNDSLGDLRKGNLVMFAARPEAGKTTMLASEATYMATQLPPEDKILYLGNEEAIESVKMRMYSAALNVSLPTLKSDIPKYEKEYARLMGGDLNKIMLVGKANMTCYDVQYWCKRVQPALIVIDQLRKVQGFNDMKPGIQRLEKTFQWARELSKEYAPVLTVGQLDAEADGEQYPGMNRLYESKTAAQGECDAIIMIGHVPGSVPANARWLNIVKNKCATPGNPALRHARHEVMIDPESARYK